MKCVLSIIRRELQRDQRWHKYAERCVGVSEETTTGVHRLCKWNKWVRFCSQPSTTTLTKSKFDTCGCKHSPQTASCGNGRRLAGKRALVAGFGDVGGCAFALKAAGTIVYVSKSTQFALCKQPWKVSKSRDWKV